MGAAQSHDGVVNVGVASHITAAAPGGPRYDARLTSEERRHQSNGIWLCQIHGKLVDSDEAHFAVEILQKWKRNAEESSFRAIVALTLPATPAPVPEGPDAADREFIGRLNLPASDDLDSVTIRCSAAAREDLAAFKRMPIWPQHPIALRLTINDGNKARSFDAPGLAAAMDAFNEIVVVAPPGTGKTTTLLQTIESALSRVDLVPIYVPLGEWSSQTGSILQSITQRQAFLGVQEGHLKLLARFGRLALVMDGWNELDAGSRKRATVEIKKLQREFTDLRVLASTRRQALDLPVSGPVVDIAPLSEVQQLEIARVLRKAEGETILDHAWRTSGIRELVAIPLYLSALIAHSKGGALPTTKEEVLRLFVTEHEHDADKAAALRDSLFGFHTDMLRAIAVAMTRIANTSISENGARAAVAAVEQNLAAAGQLTTIPQPTTVLDVLVNHHVLVRAGGASGGISFQHQQFQEWYASFEIESVMLAACAGDAIGRQQLRVALNDYAWEEAILFACERAARTGDAGARAVAAAIVETLSIDPMLAAEMIYRSADAVWNKIQQQVVDFGTRWHRSGTVDRAVRFMITTGRPEFAPLLWPLISNSDSQVYLATLRAGRRFRPSVLGPDRRAKIALLPEEQRAAVLSDIAHWSGIDGIELAAKIAQADASPAVRTAVAEALLFRRADRAAADVLRAAPDEVWSTLARQGYAREVADPDAAQRLRSEHLRLIEAEQNPLKKLHAFLDYARDGHDVRKEVRALIESPEFAANDQHAAWAVAEAHKLYAGDVVVALTHRLEAGMEIPFRAEQYLQAAEIAIDEGPLVDIVLGPDASRKITRSAAAIAGPQTVGRLIDLLIPVHAAVTDINQPASEAVRQRHQELTEKIANASLTSLGKALLARSGTDKPAEIGLFADLLSRHSDPIEQPLLRFREPLLGQFVELAERWAEVLMGTSDSTRSQLANVATVMGRLAAPEFVPVLGTMLAEDLKRWRAVREEFVAVLNKGVRMHSGAQTSWTLQYRRAFAAIGGDLVVTLMKSYLPDRGYCGFGVDAAQALREIWQRSQQPSSDKRLIPQPDFSGVRARRAERLKHGTAASEPKSFAADIIAVVNDLIGPGSDDEAHAHAMQLACVAFSMPYAENGNTIDALLKLSQPSRVRQKLLTVLVAAGEVIKSGMILDAIKALLEDARTKQWMLSDQSWWEWEQWLMLMPFSDRPAGTMEALELLEPMQPYPWRLRGLLTALGYAPSPEALDVLMTLARKDARFLAQHDWLRALELRGVSVMARTLFELIRDGAYAVKPGAIDNWALSRKLAAGVIGDPGLKAQLYQEYERNPGTAQGALFEQTISEIAEKDGVLVLVRGHARQNKAFPGALYSAIRNVAEGTKPSATWAGASEVFSRGVQDLRKELFGMTIGDLTVAQLAAACLTAIDQIRDDHGPAESEFRHPDIDTGRPWPILPT